MKNSKVLKGYLFLSGIILTVIGSLTTFNPIPIKAEEGIDIAGNASALNDVRSFGMLLLGTALLLITGALKSSVRKSATLSAVILFLSLGIGRVFSMLIDGIPSEGIIKATGIEFVFGIIGLILFFIHRERNK